MTRTLIALALMATPAAAFCDLSSDACWPRPTTIKDTPKQVRGWVKHAPARVIVKRDVILKVEGVDEPGTCRPSVSVVGDEARSKEAAELQARQHFMKTVRFHHGEKFIEIGNARDVFFQCSRSDFPITGGKIGALADAVSHSWRCSIKATPCAQSIVREEK